MAYIGNEPEIGFNTLVYQKFNGTGACTQFTISQPISDPNYLEVLVNNVQQEPYASYDVASGLITFTEAPSVGANNIQVGMKSSTIVYFNQITSAQLVDGSIAGTKLVENTITGNKLGLNSIRGNNIVVGQITGNLIAIQAVSGNQIGLGAITGNNFAQPITGNLIADTAVASNNIVVGAITGNLIGINSINASNSIVALSITGNLIGTGAISSNNFAGGGVTSGVLSSNLTISTVRLAETINVITGSLSGNYSLHLANSTVYHTIANSAGHVTFNMIANTTHTLNQMLSIGQSVSTSILLKQGSTRWRANVHIDGVLQTAYWAGNTQPIYYSSASQAMTYDAYNFSIIKIAESQYTVFASNTLYGQANGQGMGVSTPFGPAQ
jgi:hypothetical protein